MQTSTTILNVDGQAAFVIMPYVDYVRLMNNSGSRADGVSKNYTDAGALQLSSYPVTKIAMAAPVAASSPQDVDMPSPFEPALDDSQPEPVLADESPCWTEEPVASVDPTEIPHTVIQLIARQGWSLIRAWREHLGLRKQDIAQQVGISTESYSLLERSETPLGDTMYGAIAQAMGIDPGQIQPRRTRTAAAPLVQPMEAANGPMDSDQRLASAQTMAAYLPPVAAYPDGLA